MSVWPRERPPGPISLSVAASAGDDLAVESARLPRAQPHAPCRHRSTRARPPEPVSFLLVERRGLSTLPGRQTRLADRNSSSPREFGNGRAVHSELGRDRRDWHPRHVVSDQLGTLGRAQSGLRLHRFLDHPTAHRASRTVAAVVVAPQAREEHGKSRFSAQDVCLRTVREGPPFLLSRTPRPLGTTAAWPAVARSPPRRRGGAGTLREQAQCRGHRVAQEASARRARVPAPPRGGRARPARRRLARAELSVKRLGCLARRP